MSVERNELRRLVEDLPDERVPAVLAEVRRQHERQASTVWPPSWFASFASGRHDLSPRAVRPRHMDALTLLP